MSLLLLFYVRQSLKGYLAIKVKLEPKMCLHSGLFKWIDSAKVLAVDKILS